MALINQSTTVQKIFDFVKLNTKLQNFFGNGGIVNQPGLMMAEMANQMLVSLNEPWKFNRIFLGSPPLGNGRFMPTQYGIQDYFHAGSSMFSLENQAPPSPPPPGNWAAGGVGIDLYSNAVNFGFPGGYTTTQQTQGIVVNPVSGVVTVQFLQPHPGFVVGQQVYMSGNSQPCYNSQFYYSGQTNQPTIQGGITAPMTAQWNNPFTLTAVPDIYHVQFASTTAMRAIISSVAVASGGGFGTFPNVGTVTCSNAFIVGESVTISGLSNASNTWLNNLTVTVRSASASQFTFWTAQNSYGSTADTGYAVINDGAPGINNWGYMESVSATDFNSLSFPQPVQPWISVDRLAETYYPTGDKHPSVAMIQDMNNGILRFRLSEPMGTYPYAVNFGYQARAPKFSSPQDIIQWRDDLVFTFMEVVLWLAFRQCAGTSAAETQMQKQFADQAIAMARIADDREDTGEAMVPDRSLMQI